MTIGQSASQQSSTPEKGQRMQNPDNVIVTPWKIEEVPLDHWFKHRTVATNPSRVTGITAKWDCVNLDGDLCSLKYLAENYLHSEHSVGDKAYWHRCGHIEPRGVVWVGRDDLYFRKDTAVINGVRYAVDGAVAVTVQQVPQKNDVYKFSVMSVSDCVLVTRDGLYLASDGEPHPQDVVPAIRMEAK